MPVFSRFSIGAQRRGLSDGQRMLSVRLLSGDVMRLPLEDSLFGERVLKAQV